MRKNVRQLRPRDHVLNLRPVHEPSWQPEAHLRRRAEALLREMAYVYHLTHRLRAAMGEETDARRPSGCKS